MIHFPGVNLDSGRSIFDELQLPQNFFFFFFNKDHNGNVAIIKILKM